MADAPFVPTGLNLFHLAAFYVAMGPAWVYGVSGGWTDSQYCWRKEYNLRCGEPLGWANRTGPYTFTRNFTRCDVAVNTTDLTGEIILKPAPGNPR